ncbi:MAG: hypothetical protein J7L10_05900 [Methanomicrobia archaeon]|nr:hypothetical protein [Methanomicrobia archaeon]RLF96586.1 MAG: hypothetical protein DRN50_01235 [Thermococci archaeon]
MPEEFWMIELQKRGRDVLYLKGYREYVDVERSYKLTKVIVLLYVVSVSLFLYGGMITSFFWKWIYLLLTCFFLFSLIISIYSENLQSFGFKKEKGIEIRNYTENFAEIIERASKNYKLSKDIVEDKILDIYSIRLSKRRDINLYEAKKSIANEFSEKLKNARNLEGEEYLNAIKNIVEEMEEGNYGYKRGA